MPNLTHLCSEINMYPDLNFVPSAFCRNGSKLLSAWSCLSRFVLSKVSVHGKLATDLGKVVTFELLSQCCLVYKICSSSVSSVGSVMD